MKTLEELRDYARNMVVLNDINKRDMHGRRNYYLEHFYRGRQGAYAQMADKIDDLIKEQTQ